MHYDDIYLLVGILSVNDCIYSYAYLPLLCWYVCTLEGKLYIFGSIYDMICMLLDVYIYLHVCRFLWFKNIVIRLRYVRCMEKCTYVCRHLYTYDCITTPALVGMLVGINVSIMLCMYPC